MGYSHINTKGTKYYLNSQEVALNNGRKNTIFYFSKDLRRKTACELPANKVVKENARTGLLFAANKAANKK